MILADTYSDAVSGTLVVDTATPTGETLQRIITILGANVEDVLVQEAIGPRERRSKTLVANKHGRALHKPRNFSPHKVGTCAAKEPALIMVYGLAFSFAVSCCALAV
jgi:hypothetical protein